MKKFILILIFSFLFFSNLNAEDRKSELEKLFTQLRNAKDLSSRLSNLASEKILENILLEIFNEVEVIPQKEGWLLFIARK